MVVKATRDAAEPELTLTSEPAAGLAIDLTQPGFFSISLTAAQTTALGAGDHVFAVYRTDGGQRARLMSGLLVVRDGV
jgi:hypothetical protein